jgi:hypothetical protein
VTASGEDIDPRAGGAKLVAAVALDHRLHRFVLARRAALVEIPSRRPIDAR